MGDPVTAGFIGVSTLMSAEGEQREGRAAQASKEFDAKTARAVGTRKARESVKAGKKLESDIRASRAAGGGGADAGTTERMGRVKEATQYDVLSSLYEGETGAAISSFEGRVKKRAGKQRALSTLISGGADIYSTFNPVEN